MQPFCRALLLKSFLSNHCPSVVMCHPLNKGATNLAMSFKIYYTLTINNYVIKNIILVSLNKRDFFSNSVS